MSVDGWTASEGDKRGQRGVLVWSIVWIAVFLVADLGVDREWVTNDAAIVVLATVVGLAGIAWIGAQARFLKNADELMRRIQLGAMALALGTGLVTAFSTMLLASGGVVDAAIEPVVLVMVATYIIGVVVGRRRYG